MEAKVRKWVDKVKNAKNEFDLSKDEDLSIALMNLISLEEHFYFTAMKTQNQKYIDMLNSVRKLRGEFMKKIVKDPEGEEWCISKHLLAASMRLIEVGTKELSSKNKEESNKCFKGAFDLYSLFFAINLGLIGTEELKFNGSTKEKNGMMQKFSNLVKEIVDCCKEW